MLQRSTKSSQLRDAAGRHERPLIGWQRWSLALGSPILFLLGLELLLALIGYGPAKTFFVKWQVRDRTLHLSNHRYCEHFVPKHLSRTPAYSVLSPKAPATRRIFVLGGSAAYGDPEPAFGFCRQLEVLLNAVSGGTRYEVVNAAVTSMNSHVARRIALDCVTLEPDLFIVYMGNNEVVGPYGPPTLPKWLYARRGFINAAMTVKQHLRLGHLLADLVEQRSSSSRPPRAWQGMEAFLSTQLRADDPKLTHCYRHFQENLRDIVLTARAQGIKTLLCTVPTNLRACPPFASLHKSGLSREDRATWETRFEAGRQKHRDGAWVEALRHFEQAAALDDTYADLAYCRAQCLDALGRQEEAEDFYRRARDLDTLRFRASSTINATIRSQAAALVREGAVLFDLERALELAFETPALGDQALVDHVHLSVRATYLAAHAALSTLRDCFPEGTWAEDLGAPERWFEAFAGGLLYDHRQADRIATTMYVRKTRPPFVHQLEHEAEMERLRQSLYQARRAARDKSLTEVEIRAGLRARPLDPYLQRRYGAFLVEQGRIDEARALYETFLQTQPFNMTLRLELAYLCCQRGQNDRALDLLISRQSPYAYSLKEALLALAVDLVRSGRYLQAESLYLESLKLDPDNLDVLANLAVIAGEKGAHAEEKRYLDRVLELDPTSVLGMINMGNHYAKTKQSALACSWFTRAVAADPYNHLAHVGLGIQTVAAGNIDEGVPHIIQAVKLKPDFAEGYATLETIYRRIGLDDKAQTCAELKRLLAE